MTRQAMLGAATLIIAISARAALLPCWSIIQAAFKVRSRACSIMIRASAIRSCVTVVAARREVGPGLLRRPPATAVTFPKPTCP